MHRRRWLRLAAGSGAALALGAAGGTAWLGMGPAPVATFPDSAAALRWIDVLLRQRHLRAHGPWPLPQVLEHAAQSVEFSLEGYPELRAPLFRSSVGPIAFRVFARRGRMAHDTGEPIPGAPALSAAGLESAAARLGAALRRFEAHPADADWPPHFAFGALDKDAYRRAHLMHLADHVRSLRPA